MHPLNQLLATFGLRLSRLARDERPEIASRDHILAFGATTVRVPARSAPLAMAYEHHVGYNREIGRIAGLTCRKYPDMIAVDVGANIGDTAAIMRSACPAPIVCIDGDTALLHVLLENTRALGNVRIVAAFLGERAETRAVSIANEGWNATLRPPAGREARTASIIPLDAALDGGERARVKLLKIDTEGHELGVLRGASTVLGEGRPVVLFEHNREALRGLGIDDDGVFSLLREAGYRDALFWDCRGRFLLGTDLHQVDLIADLRDYVAFDGTFLGAFDYLDVAAFHQSDADLARDCLVAEREARNPSRPQS